MLVGGARSGSRRRNGDASTLAGGVPGRNRSTQWPCAGVLRYAAGSWALRGLVRGERYEHAVTFLNTTMAAIFCWRRVSFWPGIAQLSTSKYFLLPHICERASTLRQPLLLVRQLPLVFKA